MSIPSAGPAATKMMQLVQTNLDHPDVVRAVSWLVTGAANFPEGQEALKMLGTTFTERQGIAEAVKQLEYHGLPAEPVLNAVIQKNNHREEKAAALYALGAIHFKNFDASADRVSGEASKNKALDCFQQLNAEYADVTIQGFKLSDFTAKMLFEMTNLQVGCEAPEIEGKDADGVSLKLSDYRGKTVVVVFWGSWCHACHGVLDSLLPLLQPYGDRAVMLGVNTDPLDTLKQQNVPWRNWADEFNRGPISAMWNIRHWPTIFVIDKDGVLRGKDISGPALEQMLKTLNP
jgi:thiol-disulfide isomerase/thioredoxin